MSDRYKWAKSSEGMPISVHGKPDSRVFGYLTDSQIWLILPAQLNTQLDLGPGIQGGLCR